MKKKQLTKQQRVGALIGGVVVLLALVWLGYKQTPEVKHNDIFNKALELQAKEKGFEVREFDFAKVHDFTLSPERDGSDFYVHVVATGEYPNDCYVLDEMASREEKGVYYVVVSQLKLERDNCSAEPLPFKEDVWLVVSEKAPKGTHKVNVNGIVKEFLK